MKKIFHLEKNENHYYYGSLTELFRNNADLGISKFTLDKWDWKRPFENNNCVVRKSVIILSKRKKS